MLRRVLGTVATLGVLGAAPLRAQTFEVFPDSGRITVGDVVSLRLRIHLALRDAFRSRIPAIDGTLPAGMRIVGVDSFVRVRDTIYESRMRVVFLRPGKQTVPPISAFYRSNLIVQHGVRLSDPVTVDVTPLLPPGNPSLRDIRELEPGPALGPLPWIIAALLAAALWVLRGLFGRGPSSEEPDTSALDPDPPLGPYEIALARLTTIDREGWALRGQVARHYEAVADVLREYLEATGHCPARRCTTSELIWALPPALAEPDRRERTREVLDAADLVKFALVRPGAADAARTSRSARALLEEWHRVSAAPLVEAMARDESGPGGADEAGDAVR
jgi:hypothetical protein